MALVYQDPYSAMTGGLLRGLEFARRQAEARKEQDYRDLMADISQQRLNVEKQRFEAQQQNYNWDKGMELFNTGMKIALKIPDPVKQTEAIRKTVEIASNYIPEVSSLVSLVDKAKLPDVKQFYNDANQLWKAYKNRDWDEFYLKYIGFNSKYGGIPHFGPLIQKIDKFLQTTIGAYKTATTKGLIPAEPEKATTNIFGIPYAKPIEPTDINTLIKAGEANIYKVFGVPDNFLSQLMTIPEDQKVNAIENILGEDRGIQIYRALSNYHSLLALSGDEIIKNPVKLRLVVDDAINLANKGINLREQLRKINIARTPDEVRAWLTSMVKTDPDRIGLYRQKAIEAFERIEALKRRR